MTMRLSRRVKWGLGLSLAAVALLVLVMRPEVVPVDVAPVEPGPLSVTIDEDGLTRFRRHAEIAAPVSGRLLASALQVGDSVFRGQVVARLAPAPLDERSRQQGEAALSAAGSAKAQAETRVRQADVLLTDARRERSRAERLGAAGALSNSAVEAAQSQEKMRERDFDAARSALDAAVQNERQARLALLGASASGASGVVEVRAPMDGRVLRLVEEHERVVVAGTPLLEVGIPGDVEIVVDVLSSDAARISAGARMLVHVPQGPEFSATVTRVEPAAFTKVSPLGVEEQRVNVIASPLSPPSGLGHRFRVATSIVLWSAESVLTVPSTSLVPMEEGWGVFVVEKGRARLRMLELGQHGTRSVEVTGGLEAGDVVIQHPDERIAEGTRVETR
jgi:HlyD family secretion protein